MRKLSCTAPDIDGAGAGAETGRTSDAGVVRAAGELVAALDLSRALLVRVLTHCTTAAKNVSNTIEQQLHGALVR